ncbi:MAG TPA: hypothetical protein VMR98_00235 [Candidatus Polarisedimenticolaceae bacterium]|nr:hypothetical protein [Candidatus Polarisedimenticolaceae bacterium]
MDKLLQTLVALAPLILGLGGLIAGYVTFRLNKTKELEFKRREHKQQRYKSTLLFMDAYLRPENITYLRSIHAALKDANDTREWLRAEYHDMVLYASREVVMAVKHFITTPSDTTFATALMAMRKDLWVKRGDLEVADLELTAKGTQH